MTKHVPIHGLFETHLTVSDLHRSIAFYRDIVGLQLALEVSERNAAFFWVGDNASRRSMLGLWSVGTAPIGLNLHIAFEVAAINVPLRYFVRLAARLILLIRLPSMSIKDRFGSNKE
jgi:catechol 2,3-dioxygenase-like lactoylglutathione lyase family enzyme